MYFINCFFVIVELIDKIVIEVGYVGVVVLYVGLKGQDMLGEDYKYGEFVEKGYRGVWREFLMSGKYVFNIYVGKIVKVLIINIILKWISNQIGMYCYDENFKEVSFIIKDVFELFLLLVVVFYIDYRKVLFVV